MYEFIKNAVFILLLLALGSSIYYSVKFRRQTDAILRGLYQAKQNIVMGVMLILLSVYPLYLIVGRNITITIGILFLLLGLFNLFAGIRNHAIYRSRLKKH